jgi:hypothetical protein
MVEAGQQYMQRRSKYDMLEMDIATNLVIETAKSFSLGTINVDVGGNFSLS